MNLMKFAPSGGLPSIWRRHRRFFQRLQTKILDLLQSQPRAQNTCPLIAARGRSLIIWYETYFRRMRQTGETKLNLDVVNLLAYPLQRNCAVNCWNTPQEVILAMDQVAKDLMLEVTEQDQQDGLDGIQGIEGDEEVNEIMLRGFFLQTCEHWIQAVSLVSVQNILPLTRRRHHQAGMHWRSLAKNHLLLVWWHTLLTIQKASSLFWRGMRFNY